MREYEIKVLGKYYFVIDHSFAEALRQLWEKLFTDADRKRFKSEFSFKKKAIFIKSSKY